MNGYHTGEKTIFPQSSSEGQFVGYEVIELLGDEEGSGVSWWAWLLAALGICTEHFFDSINYFQSICK